MKKLLITKKNMTPEEERIIEKNLEEVASILYNNASPEELKDFETVELSVRQKIIDIVAPSGIFF